MVRKCVEKGALVAIVTDAHAPSHLRYFKIGLGLARRGWAKERGHFKHENYGGSKGVCEEKKKINMPRHQNTKEKILESALKLFLEKGIRETTIKDIAKDMGITEGAIYRHFVSKDQIVRTLFSTYAERLYEELISVVEEKTSIENGFLSL